MAQESDQIKERIDSERVKLETDLHEVEHRVEKITDWRQHFEQNPLAVMGAAAAGGLLLGLLLPRSADVSQPRIDSRPRFVRNMAPHINTLASTLDNTAAALVGVATSRIRDFVGDKFPNFREQYAQAESRRARPAASA